MVLVASLLTRECLRQPACRVADAATVDHRGSWERDARIAEEFFALAD